MSAGRCAGLPWRFRRQHPIGGRIIDVGCRERKGEKTERSIPIRKAKLIGCDPEQSRIKSEWLALSDPDLCDRRMVVIDEEVGIRGVSDRDDR